MTLPVLGICLSLFFFFFSFSIVQASVTSSFPNDPFFERQWYLRQVQAPDAWQVSTGSRDIIVAVVDTGIDIDHPDLKDNIWTNEKEISGDGKDNDDDGFVDDVHGWNFVTHTSDTRPVYKQFQNEDSWSHGTMVASLIAAKGGNGIGMAGMSWNARILPLVALNADGDGQTEDVVRAIRFAETHGADIINLSLVGYEYDAELEREIKHATDIGILVVAANGNNGEREGINIDEVPAYPVCLDSGINAVVGVGGTDTLDQKAPFSNYGHICTDLSAPAQQLFVARPNFAHTPGATSTVSGYREDVTGTSLAAPLVSGAAALIKSVRPEWRGAQIRDRLLDTLDLIDRDATGTERGRYGAGRLNVGRAISGLVQPKLLQAPCARNTSCYTKHSASQIKKQKPALHKKKPARRK